MKQAYVKRSCLHVALDVIMPLLGLSYGISDAQEVFFLKMDENVLDMFCPSS